MFVFNMKRLLVFMFGVFGINMISADYGMMGSGYTYGMMGSWGILFYLLVLVNLVLLAIYLYKKIWNKK